MNKELIKVSKEKGFESNHFNVKLTKHTSLIYYLWLCELQKWLRDEHRFVAWIESMYYDGFNYIPKYEYLLLEFHESVEIANEWDSIFDTNHDTYESALEKLLFEALKLIK